MDCMQDGASLQKYLYEDYEEVNMYQSGTLLRIG